MYSKIFVCDKDSFQLLLRTENANTNRKCIYYASVKDFCVCMRHSLLLKSVDQKPVLIFF